MVSGAASSHLDAEVLVREDVVEGERRQIVTEPLTTETKPGRRWLVPAVLILTPVVFSFLAWAGLNAWCSMGGCVPGFWLQLRGFLEPAQITAPGLTLLLVWYGTLVLLTTAGWRLGSATDPRPDIARRTWGADFERRYFLLILAAAFVGVGYSYSKIMSNTSILDSLTSQTGNSFTNSLSGSAGVETLRYATIIAAPVSIYLWRKKMVRLPFVVAAVLLLLMNAMIASRLALLMSVVVYLAIATTARGPASQTARRRVPRAVVLGVAVLVGFSTLTAMNFFRNGAYYRAAGVTDPVAMNVYQMGSYLAVPAQVSLGVADKIMSGEFDKTGSPVGSVVAIEPSFFVTNKVRKDDATPENEQYGYAVSFAPNFTTNSVFADIYGQFGAWGLFYILVGYSFAGYLFGRFLRYGPVIAGTGGVLAYCMVELWRVQILSQGIVIFLILLSIGCGAVAAALGSARLGERKGAHRE